ncbi:hypothetical protein EJB05_15820, partial [Eragrostis curvula]
MGCRWSQGAGFAAGESGKCYINVNLCFPDVFPFCFGIGRCILAAACVLHCFWPVCRFSHGEACVPPVPEEDVPYLESVIQERATTVAAELDDDLLGVLLRLQKDGGMQFALTNESISAVIFDIFSAGSDTSSYTLQWAISELIKNPRVLLKAQSEVRDTFKGQHVLTEDNMVKLSYMHMVIKETLKACLGLRLHPPAALLPRECRETCRIMGYDVPRGSAVAVNVWAIGRDSKYWNTPEEFQPERFENSGIDFKGTDFEFVPFGAGRRICPGMALAARSADDTPNAPRLANMELALASLLYHFDWKLPAGLNNEELDMTEAFGLTIKRKSKLLLHARRQIL